MIQDDTVWLGLAVRVAEPHGFGRFIGMMTYFIFGGECCKIPPSTTDPPSPWTGDVHNNHHVAGKDMCVGRVETCN